MQSGNFDVHFVDLGRSEASTILSAVLTICVRDFFSAAVPIPDSDVAAATISTGPLIEGGEDGRREAGFLHFSKDVKTLAGFLVDGVVFRFQDRSSTC